LLQEKVAVRDSGEGLLSFFRKGTKRMRKVDYELACEEEKINLR
jgi:hypothetical protein